VACNTASAEALRALQQDYLPKQYPEKKVLGMIVPIVEEISRYARVGLIGTNATIASKAYEKEAAKRAPTTKVIPLATALLVPLIENGGRKFVRPVLKEYLSKFKNKKIEALVLGCTHYPIIKKEIRELLPKSIALVSQETVIPKKAKTYLEHHPEIETGLSRNGTREFFVTEATEAFSKTASSWFGSHISIRTVAIERS
jgi:glutamate racemase